MGIKLAQVPQLHGWEIKDEEYDYKKEIMDSQSQRLLEGDDKNSY